MPIPLAPRRAAALAAALHASPLPGGATTLSFVQRGFTDGAALRFTVTGTDANADGFLEREARHPIDEITGFALSFSGNALIAPFVLGLDALLIFGIDLAAPDFLAPDAIVFAGDTMVAYLAGASAGTDCVDVFLCGFVAAIAIDLATAPPVLVPEPAGLGLLGLAAPALLALRRRYIPSARR
jgi:hypothetical protein